MVSAGPLCRALSSIPALKYKNSTLQNPSGGSDVGEEGGGHCALDTPLRGQQPEPPVLGMLQSSG